MAVVAAAIMTRPGRFSSMGAVVLTCCLACSTADKSASTDTAKVSATAPGAATPDAAASDTAGCGLVAQQAHDNPDSLIAEYLRRDGGGEFARSSTWRDQAVYCPLQAPGWDGLTLVAGYNVTTLSRTPDSLRLVVHYSRIGLLEQDSAGYMVKRDSAQESDTAMVARTPYGWRLYGWDQEPHLLPAGALTLPTMKAADRKKLKAMIAR